LTENAILTAHRHGLVEWGFLRRGRAAEFATRVLRRFDVRARGVGATASSLSGGNLQKFIVGREIELEPRILLVSQPTWGVDVGAAATIRQTLVDISRAGAAVIVFSEELEEILEIADRIQVMHKGRLSRPLVRDHADRETVGLMMGGATMDGLDTAGGPTGGVGLAKQGGEARARAV
jgi:simple sugar transport system ATP-binding protein